MRAAVFESFRGPVSVQNVELPPLADHSATIKVEACGICRSDWHAWMGHDSDVHLPHVPGHELAGTIADVGPSVRNWKPGDRVTVPFSCGCGTCEQCLSGHHQICDNYTQPGFTQWGAFAEYVQIHHADINLVALPDSISYATAASLGCRFATAFRAVVRQGEVTGGDLVAVHGCGGVGLSAIMIASSLGARVIAIDIHKGQLEKARECGAEHVLNATEVEDIADAVREMTRGGAGVSIDALGSRQTCYNSVACLNKRGRHVQVGLTLGSDTDPPIPMSAVIGKELEIVGSHGMQAFDYPAMMSMIECGRLQPELLVGRCVTLDDACQLLPDMNLFSGIGVTIITDF